eukprot:2724271-Pyramimonas_sp.AAC.1
MNATRSELVPVFTESLAGTAPRERMGGAGAVPDVDEDFEEEGYQKRIGRWLGEVLEYISSDQFWGDLYLAHISRSVTDHMAHWLQKCQGDARTSTKPPIVEMVCEKVSHLESEFNELVDDDRFMDVWRPLLDVVGHRDAPYWTGRIVQFSLEAATDFHWRVLRPSWQFPRRLAWMVWELPHISCPHRARVAHDLLVSEPVDINDEATLKFGRLFAAELVQTARTGELPLSMYEFLCD